MYRPPVSNPINNQASAVIYFMQQLDVEMVEQLLDSQKQYSDLEWAIFISKLNNVFNIFLAAGDSHLLIKSGTCTADECNNLGCSGYTFKGNNSGYYLDLVVIVKDGIIEDMFDCNILNVGEPNRPYEKKLRINRLELRL
jgi:hypothetical protein